MKRKNEKKIQMQSKSLIKNIFFSYFQFLKMHITN